MHENTSERAFFIKFDQKLRAKQTATQITRYLDGKLIKLSVTKKNSYFHVRTGLRKQKIGDYKIFNFFANAKLKFSS